MTEGKLVAKARWVRQKTVEMTVAAGMGHIAPAFSCTEILVSLYYAVMDHAPSDPEWPERDRFVLSKGQACAALYAILADFGYFDEEELHTHCQAGSRLGGHSETNIPGVEAYTGSLGHGLSIAVGMAMAAKMRNDEHRVYCVCGDGECQEGSIWEAAMLASHHRLANLMVIVDVNKQQAIDFTGDVMHMNTNFNFGNGGGSLYGMWASAGWHVKLVDGHSFQDLISGNNGKLWQTSDVPVCVLADTVKGKGVPEIEGVPIWHYRIPTTLEEMRWFVDALYDEPPGWYTDKLEYDANADGLENMLLGD